MACSGRFVNVEGPLNEDGNETSCFDTASIERFARNPEIMERVNKLEAEIAQLEEARQFQIALDPKLSEGEPKDPSKRDLLRAIDGRLKALQPELLMAVAHAAAEGFSHFGTPHLRDACSKFIASEKQRDMLGHKQCNESGEAEEFETTSHHELSINSESESESDVQKVMGCMPDKQDAITSPSKIGTRIRRKWGNFEVTDKVNDISSTENISLESEFEQAALESGLQSGGQSIEFSTSLFESKQKGTRNDTGRMKWSRDSDMSIDFLYKNGTGCQDSGNGDLGNKCIHGYETNLSQEKTTKVDSEIDDYSTSMVPSGPKFPSSPGLEMEYLKEMVENRNKDRQLEEDQECRGERYELYRQKREEKLREEPASKRLENDAKFRAMEIFLQQSKRKIVEMRNSPWAIRARKEAQEEKAAEAEYNVSDCSPLKEQASKDNINKQIRKVTFGSPPPPSMDFLSPPTKSSSIPPMPSPLTTSNFISTNFIPSNKRKNPSSMAKNPLARSVPNFTDLRKENKKPFTARSGLGFTSAHQKPKPTGSSSSYDPSRPKTTKRGGNQSTSPSPVKGDHSRSADSSMEKKWRNKDVMKSCASVSELRNMKSMGGGVGGTPLKLPKTSSSISISSFENKPFLRKGRGLVGASATGRPKVSAREI